MSVDKNKAIVDYIITCPLIYKSPLYFNFINAKDSTKQIMTIANDRYTSKPYIDGSVSKVYTFTIIDFRSVSEMAIVKLSGYNSENIEELSDVQSLIDWIAEQNENRIYPDFGSDCVIEQIRTTTDIPNFDGIKVDVTPPLAMYSVTIEVSYIDYSKQVWR
jgi:hypothetical protein